VITKYRLVTDILLGSPRRQRQPQRERGIDRMISYEACKRSLGPGRDGDGAILDLRPIRDRRRAVPPSYEIILSILRSRCG